MYCCVGVLVVSAVGLSPNPATLKKIISKIAQKTQHSEKVFNNLSKNSLSPSF